MNAPMIVFGEDWGAHPSSTQHLMTRLAADRKILWVNSIGLRRPQFNGADLKRVMRKLASMAKPSAPGICESPDGLTVASARAISWPGSQIARRINRRIIPKSLSQHLAKIGPDRPILWTSLPSAVDVIGEFDEIAVIYYAGDDFEGLAGVDHVPVGQMERELAARADLIIAASETIAAKFPADRAVVLPHGCDLDRFGTAASPANDLPTDRPVAGFYGSLADWLDYDLLVETARLCPDWDFVFIGNVTTDASGLEVLKAMPNTRFLGARDHADLPAYVQNWDASLLPFVDNAQIRACNPLKLREYLAAGTPVVSTTFPALAPYRNHVAVVATAREFAQALDVAAQEGQAARLARQQQVAGESWEARASDLDRMITALCHGA